MSSSKAIRDKTDFVASSSILRFLPIVRDILYAKWDVINIGFKGVKPSSHTQTKTFRPIYAQNVAFPVLYKLFTPKRGYFNHDKGAKYEGFRTVSVSKFL